MEDVAEQDSVGRGKKVVGLVRVTADAGGDRWRAVGTAGEGRQTPQQGESQERGSQAAHRDELSKVQACVWFFRLSLTNICDWFFLP